MLITLLSYSTPSYGSVYRKYLAESIFQLQIKNTHILADDSTWIKSTQLKPGIILAELKKGNPVLYVDSDAVITSREVMDIDALIPPEYIAGCYFLDWDKWCGGRSGLIEPLTGTLFFRPAALPLVEQWVRLAEGSTEPDGKAWAKAIEGRTDIYNLPIEYCYIHSLPNGNKGNIRCDKPLIVHYQQSRIARGENA